MAAAGRQWWTLLGQAVLLACHTTVMVPDARGQVVPGGLGTRVNGSALGRCTSGTCSIQGGTAAGGNLFLRLNRYDTRSGIERVDLDTRRRQTVVVGVGDPAGSFFATPLKLNTPANLIWVSPGGLWLGAGMQVINAPSQLFSTSPSLRLGSGVFQAVGGDGDLSGLAAAVDLDPGDGGVGQRLGLGGSAPLVLAGGRLVVDRHLLLDSGRGPIVSAAGSSSELRAGGSLQLSGGQLDLQRLRVDAGGAVALQALADGGQARVRQSEIVGQQVLVRGHGGLSVEDLTLRANGAGATGGIRLETANDPTADAHLRNVNLQGNGVLVRAGGNLSAQQLKAEANQTGTVQLESANGTMALGDTQLLGQQVVVRAARQLNTQGLNALASDDATGKTWLEAGQAQLQQTALRGHEVVVDTRGDLMADDLSITAGPTGREGTIWLQAGQGEGGTAGASADLKRLTMQGQEMAVIATGNLSGEGWKLSTDSNGSSGRITIATGQDSLRNNGGSARLLDADLTAKMIQLRAAGGYALERMTALSNPERIDTAVEFDTGVIEGPSTQEEGLLGGAASLVDLTLRGRQILIRGGKRLGLDRVTAEAGVAGDRGIIQLETKSGDDNRTGSELKLQQSKLSARQIVLRGGNIRVQDNSQLQAPKGWIHIEATGKTNDPVDGGIFIRNSSLDLGVSSWEDLKATVDSFSGKFGDNKSTIYRDTPPSIGLFSSDTISLEDQATLRSTLNLDPLEQQDSAKFWQDVRISDISGAIAIDAANQVSINNAVIEADASHNLAGTVAIRSRNSDGQAGIVISRNTKVSASGGAGAGDIWLSSNNGVVIADSTLQSISDRASKEDAMFGGGEITVTNNSITNPIRVIQSQLVARQVVTSKSAYSPKTKIQGLSDLIIMSDAYDSENDKPLDKYLVRSDPDVLGLGGGTINLVSRSGIRLDGKNTVVSTSSLSDEPDSSIRPEQSFGGVTRLINTGEEQILVSGGAHLTGEINSDDPSHQYGRKSELLIWNSGPINLDQALISMLNLGLEPRGDTSFAPAVALSSGKAIHLSSTVLAATASNENRLPNIVLRSVLQSGVSLDDKSEIVSQHGRHPLDDLKPQNSINPKDLDEYGKFSIPSNWQGIHGTTEGIVDDKPSSSIQDQRVNGSLNYLGFTERIRLTGSDATAEAVVIQEPGRPAVTISSQLPITILNSQPSRSAPFPTWNKLQLDTRLESQPMAKQDLKSDLSGMIPINTKQPGDTPPPISSDVSLSTQVLTASETINTLQDGEEKSLYDAIKAFRITGEAQRSFNLSSLQTALQSTRTTDYRPAALRLQLSSGPNTETIAIDHILITSGSPPKGWRTYLPKQLLQSKISSLRHNFNRFLDEEINMPHAGLGDTLLGPALKDLHALQANAILLSLDRGLQGIPFSAIKANGKHLGEDFAFTVTPSLVLTNLQIKESQFTARSLVGGANQFKGGLPSLPLARQEAENIARVSPNSVLLFNEDFTPSRIAEVLSGNQPVRIIHLTTHADFSDQDSASARIYTPQSAISLATTRSLLNNSNHAKDLDLFILSACRTSLGSEANELGITGLALQVGAASSLGTLWYVDDAASAAFLIKFHALLNQGLKKDIALQMTQQLFRHGQIRVLRNQIIDERGITLITDLSPSDAARLNTGLSHPYYWAGMVLAGRPW